MTQHGPARVVRASEIVVSDLARWSPLIWPSVVTPSPEHLSLTTGDSSVSPSPRRRLGPRLQRGPSRVLVELVRRCVVPPLVPPSVEPNTKNTVDTASTQKEPAELWPDRSPVLLACCLPDYDHAAPRRSLTETARNSTRQTAHQNYLIEVGNGAAGLLVASWGSTGVAHELPAAGSRVALVDTVSTKAGLLHVLPRVFCRSRSASTHGSSASFRGPAVLYLRVAVADRRLLVVTSIPDRRLEDADSIPMASSTSAWQGSSSGQ